MQVDLLIQKIVDEIRQVDGVKAVVLGGSRARGTHTTSSDIDLGIYYQPEAPLDLKKFGAVATGLDDEHRAEVITPVGGWGPWINGGGWLKIQSQPVDFLYRDLEKVRKVIDDCLQGNIEIFYQPGHPFGFVSSMYLAELAVCQPLWDPAGSISELKRKIDPYPEALQNALVQKFAWEIQFSLAIARKGAERSDVTYVAGCCFRSVMCMLQGLFALNKTHWLNEKGAVAAGNNFPRKPEGLQSRINEIFQLLEANPLSMQSALLKLEELSQDISRIDSER